MSPSNPVFVADADYLESPDTLELDGVYHPDWGAGRESRYARLYFDEDFLQQVSEFTSEEEFGAPRVITPHSGNTSPFWRSGRIWTPKVT